MITRWTRRAAGGRRGRGTPVPPTSTLERRHQSSLASRRGAQRRARNAPRRVRARFRRVRRGIRNERERATVKRCHSPLARPSVPLLIYFFTVSPLLVRALTPLSSPGFARNRPRPVRAGPRPLLPGFMHRLPARLRRFLRRRSCFVMAPWYELCSLNA